MDPFLVFVAFVVFFLLIYPAARHFMQNLPFNKPSESLRMEMEENYKACPACNATLLKSAPRCPNCGSMQEEEDGTS